MKTLQTILVVALVLGLAGCSDDDSTSPQNEAELALNSSTAEEFSLMAMELVNGMVGQVPDLAAGEFGGWQPGAYALDKAGEDNVTWDPAQMAWVLNFAADFDGMELPNYGHITYASWIQFRNGSAPQQSALGATEMELRGDYTVVTHFEGDGNTFDLAMDMNSEMIVSYLSENLGYGVVGSGSMNVLVASSSPQASENGSLSVAWAMDVTTSEYGCPSGTATVTAQQWQMVTVYNGEGGASWTLTGPNYTGSGFETVECATIEVGQN